METEREIAEVFGNRLRVRACGICAIDDTILLIKHKNIGKAGYLWAPPGGGVSFGESIEASLIREFKEETGLVVDVKDFLFAYEFIEPPLHAIELFFNVEVISGILVRGKDPELGHNQIIEMVKFCDDEFIKNERPDGMHAILTMAGNIDGIQKLSGYISCKS